ncbi:MAG: hypothetical protein WAK55_09720 [Xanthobacteraceae bacterium]|jgi:hypothetical protein
MNRLFGLGIVLLLLMPLSARSQQLDFGMTPTEFLHAINTISVRVKVRIIRQTSAMIEYGIGQCVVADGELDNDQRLDSVRIAPAPNDQSACPANDAEMRALVADSTAEVMEVLTDVPDIDKNAQTVAALAQNLKQDPASGLRSSETRVGQRTVQMLVTLGGRRSEFVIYP